LDLHASAIIFVAKPHTLTARFQETCPALTAASSAWTRRSMSWRLTWVMASVPMTGEIHFQ
jgi:hypothetical protein